MPGASSRSTSWVIVQAIERKSLKRGTEWLENAYFYSTMLDSRKSMSSDGKNQRKVRFGPFEADLETQELWKSGVRLKLGGQPFGILRMLLQRPGELVGREELRTSLCLRRPLWISITG